MSHTREQRELVSTKVSAKFMPSRRNRFLNERFRVMFILEPSGMLQRGLGHRFIRRVLHWRSRLYVVVIHTP